MLYGLTAPFAAALMDRFGIRRVVACALLVVALGQRADRLHDAAWQLILCWGVLVGLGTGSMALAFVATVTNRWFVARRGLVTGILTAAGATGQLVFLPLLAWIDRHHGWRAAALRPRPPRSPSSRSWLLLRDHPADLGVAPVRRHGGRRRRPGAHRRPRATAVARAARRRPQPAVLAAGRRLRDLRRVDQRPGPAHFVPAAHDHGMPVTAAAWLLAVVGVFDIVGTIASGWLTDRFDPRLLLLVYYALRGLSLLAAAACCSAPTCTPSMLAFIVFYGLDWVATVPPTVALCREQFGARGADRLRLGVRLAPARRGGGGVRRRRGPRRTGSYDLAWYVAGALCCSPRSLSLSIRRRPPPPAGHDAAGRPPFPAAADQAHG